MDRDYHIPASPLLVVFTLHGRFVAAVSRRVRAWHIGVLQRPDTVVYDEPLYAHFLRTHKEEETWRPYRDEVFKQQV